MEIKTIKQLTQETQPYFFDEQTMQFFNQKLSDFPVEQLTSTTYLISAPTYWDGHLMGHTERVFNTETNDLEETN